MSAEALADPAVAAPPAGDTTTIEWFRSARLGWVLHGLSLLGAAVILVRDSRGQWFFYDEWEFIVGRGLYHARHGLFYPHNEHWSTVPILVYRGLLGTVGLHTYLPYIGLVLALHLGVAHLLWRIMRVAGVDPIPAAALTTVYALLGAGFENLLWAFQIGFVGSVLFGLLLVHVASRPGSRGSRDLVGLGVALLAIMSSSIGVTMVAIAGLAVALRRGWQIALTTVVPPGLVYALWYVVVGHRGFTHAHMSIASLYRLPDFVWSGLSATFERVVGIPGAGPVLLLAMLAWLLRRLALARTVAGPALALAAGAAILFAIIGLGRIDFGPEQATASRYLDISAALLMPAAGLALAEICGRSFASQVVAGALLGLVLLHGVGELSSRAHAEALRERGSREQILAAADLLAAGKPSLNPQPEPQWAPDLTVDDLRRLTAEGRLPSRSKVPLSARLSAELALFVADGDHAVVPPAAPLPATLSFNDIATPRRANSGCTALQPNGPAPFVVIRFGAPGSVSLAPQAASDITVRVQSRDGSGATSASRVVHATPNVPVVLSTTVTDADIVVAFAGNQPVTLCGVA